MIIPLDDGLDVSWCIYADLFWGEVCGILSNIILYGMLERRVPSEELSLVMCCLFSTPLGDMLLGGSLLCLCRRYVFTKNLSWVLCYLFDSWLNLDLTYL